MRKKALFLLTSSMFLVACSPFALNDNHSADPKAKVGADRHASARHSSNNHANANTEKDAKSRNERVTASLLREGQQALAEDRLLTPEGDNANLYFQVVLGRDPGNYQATLGIAEIVDRYLAWAVAAAQRQDSAAAQTFLQRARIVNADDPTIAVAQQRVRALLTSQNVAPPKHSTPQGNQAQSLSGDGIYPLPKDLFEQDDAFVLAKVQPIIDEVARTEQPIQINWPNDREGRLLYQIINSRTPEFRVRAMIERNAKYSVELKDN